MKTRFSGQAQRRKEKTLVKIYPGMLKKYRSIFAQSWVFLTLAGALLTALLLFLTIKNQQSRAFPGANVLLITIDTIRPDQLSCYGGSNQTPHIDAIAERGLLFENAYCQVPLTFPSHASILTGLFPVNHGVHHNGLEVFTKKEFLIGDSFRFNGYRTGAAISSFVLDRKFGLAEGFDVYDDRMERLPSITTNFEVERPANETVDAGIAALNKWKGEKWFFWFHFYDPHTPYRPAKPRSGYSGEVQFVDEQIGRLLDWLEQKELADNTIVAVLGDHGESLGEHGEKTHGFFVYNSTLRIPLIVSYPGAKSLRVSTPVASVDLATTLLELSQIADSHQRDGISLMKTASRKSRPADIYFESKYPELLGWNGLQGLIRQNWKLISTTRSELYDLSKDPDESQNLFTANQKISNSLKKDLANLSSLQTSPGMPDAETVEKLKSLGYIASTSIPQQNRTADPKDRIALWTRYEESLELKQNPQEIERLLKSLVEQEPSNNFFRLALAAQYRQQKNLEQAAKHLQHAIQNDPSDANAYHELAFTLKEMKNYPEALRAEEAAIALQPDRSEFRGVLGMILVEAGRFQRAKSEFQQVLKMDPNNAIAWNNFGNACRALNELEDAKQAYRQAIELSPHYAYPHNGLATILVAQQKSRDAIPYFEKAIQLDPKFFEVYLNLAIAFHSLKEYDRAKTLYSAFLKIAPDWMAREKANARALLAQLN